ncbi:MAG: hypothetical protein V7K95_14865 [Nostoc sp.]
MVKLNTMVLRIGMSVSRQVRFQRLESLPASLFIKLFEQVIEYFFDRARCLRWSYHFFVKLRQTLLTSFFLSSRPSPKGRR